MLGKLQFIKMLITYTIEIIKILSTVSVKKWLLFCMSAIIIMLVLILNIYFGNFLKIPMEMSKSEKIGEYRKLHSQIKYHIGKFGTLLTREVGFECEYNIVVLDWHFTDVNPSNKTASLAANYLYVYKYTMLHGLEDRTHLLKDKGDSPNKHSVDSAFANYQDNFNENSAIYQDTPSYVNQSGVAVTNMFNNYPFEIHSKIGATIITNASKNKAMRFTLLNDEACTKKLENANKRDIIKHGMTELRNDIKNLFKV